MIGLFKNYIEKRISLLKLETTETSVKVFSMAVYVLLIMASIFLVGLLVVFSQKKSIIEKVKERLVNIIYNEE